MLFAAEIDETLLKRNEELRRQNDDLLTEFKTETGFKKERGDSQNMNQFSAADAAATMPPYSLPSNIRALASILSDIGASEFLQNFIDDEQDDNCFSTYKNPDRISKRYGLPPNLASIFVERSRARAVSSSDTSSLSSGMPSTSPVPIAAAPPPDDVSLLLALNLEFICELGRGGFGKVYKCKDATQRRTIAVKLVLDPKNAAAFMREGQKLLHASHKNIVRTHRLHANLGNGCCALEMEVVEGGNLSQHLDAARRQPGQRLPRDAVLRFTRQLLQVLVHLHDIMKWLHGDIKPQNILIQCSPPPDDGSTVDYSSAEIKLADFGLAKVMQQQCAAVSFVLTNAPSEVGKIKGTKWYLSPEAQSSSADFERSFADDVWSASLVIFEMDTGLPVQQLMTAPGAVKLDLLYTSTSPELMPLLCSVLAQSDAAARCKSAAQLLRTLDASIDPLYVWQRYDNAACEYVSVHPASSVALDAAFLANERHTMLPLQPPLDLNFDIQTLLSSPTELGLQTERRSGQQCCIRRRLRPSALTSSAGIPVWQQLLDGKEWRYCSPHMCARLDRDATNPNAVIDASRYRRFELESGSIGSVQLPQPMKTEPYLVPAAADDVTMLNNRVHDSLCDWDVTEALQIVNPALSSKYAAKRHQLASRRNGDPNERLLFHLAPDLVIPKIWQSGEGFESRLVQWAEVGKGAYFCEHLIYNFALKFGLWCPPEKFEVVPEPPVGSTMRVFAVLVSLGNVADMGVGCESCASPAFIQWKTEYNHQKSDKNPSPLPPRPPVMQLPDDAAERRHILDLNQVKDEPRYDSVMSTEGDLSTHPSSTCKTAAGRAMRDVIHPRLKTHANEWGKQYVLFDTASSYPMFLMTATKTRSSPVTARQLVDAGYNADRIKALGFTSSDVRALGKSVQEMLHSGWSVLDLKDAGFGADCLLAASNSADYPLLLMQFQHALQAEAVACVSYHRDMAFAAALCDEYCAAAEEEADFAGAQKYAAASKIFNDIVAGQGTPTAAETFTSLLDQARRAVPQIEAAQAAAKTTGNNSKAADFQNLK